MKEFIITILHEIKHALDAKQLGRRKFIKKYAQAGTMAQYKGLDPTMIISGKNVCER